MSVIRSYRELDVWKKSIDWVERIYLNSRAFPADERFGLTSQLRRAAVSVPSNIAEGAARTGAGEFLHSLSIASGSLAEAETQIVVASRLKYLSSADAESILTQTEEIGKMLGGLKRSLQSRRK